MSDMALVDWQRKAAKSAGPRFTSVPGAVVLRIAVERPLLIVSGLLLGMVGLFLLLWSGATPTKVPAAAVAAPVAPAAPAWLDIIKPIQIFSLEAPDLGKAPLVYSAKRNPTDGNRQDVLAFGTLASGEPSLRLMLRRGTHDVRDRPPLFAAIARQAADAGLAVLRSSLPDMVPTRFGQFETSDIVLSAGAPSCSGFRLLVEKPALAITGIACPGTKPTLSRARLGCLLDRLDLASGGDDRPLVDFFAASELKRNAACDGTRLGPDAVHAAWLDDRPATPRKNMRHH